jgi:Ca2+-binding RTX toxin-like protein
LNSDSGDSHPNDTAYSAAADAIADYLFTNVVGPGNHAPVAAARSVETPEDTAVAITLTATDSDGDTLTYEIVEGPSPGAVQLVGNVATYTPTDRWHGDDHFTFRAFDGEAYSNTATISISVYDPNPTVDIPAGADPGSVLVRRSSGRFQVIDQVGGGSLVDRPLGGLRSLTIRGAGDRADTVTIDWPAGAGAGLPDGVLFDGGLGGQADVLVLRGAGGADTFAIGAGLATINGLGVRLQNVEQLSLDGRQGNDRYEVSGLSARTTLIDSQGTDQLDFSQATVGARIDLGQWRGKVQAVFAGTSHTLALNGTFENVVGTAQDDWIKGNTSGNRIEGRGGNDTIYGDAGNDFLYGGAGNDTIFGGEGNDTLYGGAGNDWLYGGGGSDTLYGESGNNVLLGGAGDDRLNARLSADSTARNLLVGGAGSDRLQGGPGQEILIGGTTSYDSRAAALAAVMDRWTAGDSFSNRCKTLERGFTDPTAGFVQLKRRTGSYTRGTVRDDGVRDWLYGTPSSDWFLTFNGDVRGPENR